MVTPEGFLPMPAEADFVIAGTIDPNVQKPEGPFGDHLGYYSLAHDFPVLRVDCVFHRRGAIWPFTSVGRPPQEDTSFGAIIHELTGPIIPSVLPGVHAVHAVDARRSPACFWRLPASVMCPYASVRRPQENPGRRAANAILGQGQMSLAKYLFIVAKEDNPANSTSSTSRPSFAIFWNGLTGGTTCTSKPAQLSTRLTIRATGLNAGSQKVVVAAAGPVRRRLGHQR